MKTSSIAAALSLALVAAGAAAEPALPRMSDYRALDRAQLGHLRFIANLAQQPFNDWSRMDSAEAGQGGFDAYRYQLAMMSYTLNLANYHYTPAYREHYQRVNERLIDKMLRFDVWSFWEQTSRGAKQFDPDLVRLSEGWIDPVVRQNIMYSGHLMQMVATHAVLYDSDRYERPGALSFVHNPIGRGIGREEFRYDAGKLAETLRRQFEEGGYAGIECEPNAIFVECNQHPILGFKLYDFRHGTRLFEEVSARYLQTFEEQKFLDRSSGSFMQYKLIRQDKVLRNEFAWNDGWAGIFMHAWSRADVEAAYPLLKQKYLVGQRDGTAVIPFKAPSPLFSWDNGFFAALAAEVGDRQTVDAMLAYADRHWAPTWVDGGLYYPRNDAFAAAGADPAQMPRDAFATPRVNTLTGNALLGLARINVRDGLYGMVNAPWPRSHFSEPYVTGVAFPQAYVSRAVYDAPRQALVATLLPGDAALPGGRTALRVGNLAREGVFDIWVGGRNVGRLQSGAVVAQGGSTRLAVVDGMLAIDLALEGPVDVVVQRRS